MNTVLEAIEAKKRGGELSEEVLREVVAGYASGRVPDYQMSAFLVRSLSGGWSTARHSRSRRQ